MVSSGVGGVCKKWRLLVQAAGEVWLARFPGHTLPTGQHQFIFLDGLDSEIIERGK